MNKTDTLLELEKAYDLLSDEAKKIVREMVREPQREKRKQLRVVLQKLDKERTEIYERMDEVFESD